MRYFSRSVLLILKSSLLVSIMFFLSAAVLGINSAEAGIIESDDPEVTVQFAPGEPLDLNCKAEAGQKIWVFLEVPSPYPGIEFVRPRDSHCQEHGRYVFVFVPSRGEDLYYAESYDSTQIEFGVQDFTGLGEVIITTKKGDSSANLQTIQRIRIIESPSIIPSPQAVSIHALGFEFPTTMPEITFYFIPDKDAHLISNWIAEDVGDAAPPDYLIDSADINVEAKTLATFSITKPTKGWPEGNYRLEIKVGDEVIHVNRFVIR